jgi:hypothetical protein
MIFQCAGGACPLTVNTVKTRLAGGEGRISSLNRILTGKRVESEETRRIQANCLGFIPSFFIRASRVVRLIPIRTAAP